MNFQPLQLERCSEAFSRRDWLFEIKYDGFRAVAHIEHGRCKLVSRNGNEFKSFRSLCESLGTELKRSVILDGEIVCLDSKGKSLFYELLFRRGEPRFVAFDLLHCDGESLTYSPLVERKQRLRGILPKESQDVLYCDHIEVAGKELFALACKKDLEGIVAKYKFGPYLQDMAQWLKIRNQKYSQWAGREKFFERDREVDPELYHWDQCAIVCEERIDSITTPAPMPRVNLVVLNQPKRLG
jgi:bifunctional non-homologous end joining protein LigD